MTEFDDIKQELQDYWNNMSEEDLRRPLDEQIQQMSRDLNRPRAMIEKYIAEWESRR